MGRTESIISHVAADAGSERVDTLFATKNVTIERIVSSGTQPVAAYLQDHDEWVVLVRGEAEMTIGGERVSLKTGDTLYLPARVPHEVLETSEQALWLAVHVR